MTSFNLRLSVYFLVSVVIFSVLSGCTPLLVAGGAAAGYGVAKDAEDGKIIDSK